MPSMFPLLVSLCYGASPGDAAFIRTTDGQEIPGYVVKEEGGAWTLRTASGAELFIAAASVAHATVLPRPVLPESEPPAVGGPRVHAGDILLRGGFSFDRTTSDAYWGEVQEGWDAEARVEMLAWRQVSFGFSGQFGRVAFPSYSASSTSRLEEISFDTGATGWFIGNRSHRPVAPYVTSMVGLKTIKADRTLTGLHSFIEPGVAVWVGPGVGLTASLHVEFATLSDSGTPVPYSSAGVHFGLLGVAPTSRTSRQAPRSSDEALGNGP